MNAYKISHVENGLNATFEIDESDFDDVLKRLVQEDSISVTEFSEFAFGYEEKLPSIYNVDSDLHYDDWEYTRFVPSKEHDFTLESFPPFGFDRVFLEGFSRSLNCDVKISAHGVEGIRYYAADDDYIDHYNVSITAMLCDENALSNYINTFFPKAVLRSSCGRTPTSPDKNIIPTMQVKKRTITISELLSKETIRKHHVFANLPFYLFRDGEQLSNEEITVFETALKDGERKWSGFNSKETSFLSGCGLRVERVRHQLMYGSVDDWGGEDNRFECYDIYRIPEKIWKAVIDIAWPYGRKLTNDEADNKARDVSFKPFLKDFMSSAKGAIHITRDEPITVDGYYGERAGTARCHIAIAEKPFGLSGWYAVSYLQYEEEYRDDYEDSFVFGFA